MKKKESLELQDKFIQLRGVEGKSFQAISDELGVPRKPLLDWHKRHKARILPLMDFRLEQMAEKYRFTEIQKAEAMGIIYNRILEAIEVKDLSELPAGKLVQLLVAVQEKLPPCKRIRTGDAVIPDNLFHDEEVEIA